MSLHRAHCSRLAFILTIAVGSAGCPSALAAQLVVHETSLGPRPAGMVPRTITISAAMRLGYVVATPSGDAVVIDGARGPTYTAIDTSLRVNSSWRPYIVFSPDGTRYAYSARQDDRMLMVVDGIATEATDCVEAPAFSPDSRHVVYLAGCYGKKMTLVRDGVPGPAYEMISQFYSSPDGKHVSYTTRERSGRERVVLDGKVVGEGEQIGFPVYSHSGDHLAYALKKGQGWTNVIDGVEGQVYHYVDHAVFSRDGRRSIYVGKRQGSHVVVDGVESRAYKFVLPSSYGFNATGRHVAFAVADGGHGFWVLDGREQKHYDRVDVVYEPDFGPDGERLVYAAQQGGMWLPVIDTWEGERFDYFNSKPYTAQNGHVMYVAMRGTRQYVGVDSAAPIAFDEVRRVNPTRRVGISGRRGREWFFVVDGVASPPYTQPVRDVVESPNARCVAYVAGRDGTQFVVADSIEGKPYDEVQHPAFSPDGRHLAYGAKRLGKWMLVVDGDESPAYDEIVGFPRADDMRGEALTVIARRERTDIRVTIPWPSTGDGPLSPAARCWH